MTHILVTSNTCGDVLEDSDWKPKYLMEFASEQAAYDLYYEYGRRVGFSIRRDTHCKNKKTGEVTSRTFVCSKEGVRCTDKRNRLTKNPGANTRTGCDARMIIKLDREKGNYFVHQFVEMHNHPLVREECTQRKRPASQAIEVGFAEASGISLRSARESKGRQAGGRESLEFTTQDQNDYIQTKRQRKMADGEAGRILKYFQSRRVENPSFFYAAQLDNEEQIMNIFWADAEMLIDYGHFGDVVSFDTTYRINDENRSLAVFVGFNHHRETVVFGAALMYDETVNSFVWLFETFLEAMSNKAPKCIFTNLDATMADAISIVMPDTYHRLCRWHLMQKALKYINSVFRIPGGVNNVLLKFMDGYEEEEELVAAWDAMLDEYNLQGNSWLERLFGLREKWAKAYVKRAWSAGMRSTQRSKNFNAKLKNYLKSDYDVEQFFMHFERVINDQRHKELEAEFALSQKLPKVKIPAKMLKQAGDTYTKAIFEDFQDQYFASVELWAKECTKDGGSFVYTVTKYDLPWQWQVRREEDDYISCSCRLFEMTGILCNHAIKILRDIMQISKIPTQYILKRWTRKARAESVQDMHGHNIEADARLQQNSQYRSSCFAVSRLSSRASMSEETCEVSMEPVNDLSKIEDMSSSKIDGKQPDKDDQNSLPIECEGGTGAEFSTQDKGLKKKQATHQENRRIKGNLDKASVKKKRAFDPHSLEGTSFPTSDIYHLCPPPPSQSLQMSHDSVPWIPYRESQHTGFQALLQQHRGLGFPFDDSQALNSTACSQAIDLNTNVIEN